MKTLDSGQNFVDYYDLLQVDPGCDARILEIAYHYFAKMYHPDHVETADVDKFNEVVAAYRVLRDPDQRAEYDQLYTQQRGKPDFRAPTDEELEIDESAALSDAEIHETILLQLYKRRREHATDPGVVGWLLQEKLGCNDDQFEFHIWYLKSKKFLEITEHSTLAITIEGVDHVISTSRTSSREKLLLARLNSGAEGDAAS